MKPLQTLAGLAAMAAILVSPQALAQQRAQYDALVAAHARANDVPEALAHRQQRPCPRHALLCQRLLLRRQASAAGILAGEGPQGAEIASFRTLDAPQRGEHGAVHSQPR